MAIAFSIAIADDFLEVYFMLIKMRIHYIHATESLLNICQPWVNSVVSELGLAAFWWER